MITLSLYAIAIRWTILVALVSYICGCFNQCSQFGNWQWASQACVCLRISNLRRLNSQSCSARAFLSTRPTKCRLPHLHWPLPWRVWPRCCWNSVDCAHAQQIWGWLSKRVKDGAASLRTVPQLARPGTLLCQGSSKRQLSVTKRRHICRHCATNGCWCSAKLISTSSQCNTRGCRLARVKDFIEYYGRRCYILEPLLVQDAWTTPNASH